MEKDKKIKANFFGSYKGIGIFILLFFAGAALVFFSDNSNKESETHGEIIQSLNESEYITQTEEKLNTLISSVKGVSNVKVMLSLEHGEKYEYEREISESKTENNGQINYDIKKGLIFSTDKNGSKNPVLITKIPPSIKGVAVVCTGGGNPEIQMKLINIISCALGLPQNRIYVTD